MIFFLDLNAFGQVIERRNPSLDSRFGGPKLEEAALIKSGPWRQIEGRAEINQSFVLRP